MLHRPRIPSEPDRSAQEQGDAICLSDYSADIDPGPGVCFPRTPRDRIHTVFLDLYGPNLWEAGVLSAASDFVVTCELGFEKLPPGSAGLLSTRVISGPA